MLQSFSLLAKKRYSPRARADRGMPLAGGRNTAASNIGNIDRQTLFHAVRRPDNSRRKCRGNGEGLIKKYLQSAVITQRTRRARVEGREAEGKALARSCQVCLRLCRRRSLLLSPPPSSGFSHRPTALVVRAP